MGLIMAYPWSSLLPEPYSVLYLGPRRLRALIGCKDVERAIPQGTLIVTHTGTV